MESANTQQQQQQQEEEFKTPTFGKEESKQAEKLPYKTIREYYEDTYKCISKAKVLDLWKTEKENEYAVILDKTIFHPQGGGQPSDEGTITSEDQSIVFTVKTLQSKDDTILHFGAFDKDSFTKDQEVVLKVDETKRRLYARMHSAGHLLDMVMRRCGQNQLSPGKGYHFAVGAYVEYAGLIDMTKKDELIKEINKVANEIIKEQNDKEVFAKIMSYEDAEKALKGSVPSYMPKGQEMRVVKLTDEDDGCPCGGTHVQKVSEIQEIEVTKIIKKGKNTRVSYNIK